MKMSAASRPSAADQLALPPGEDGLPSMGDLAEAARKLLRSRGAVPRASLVSWLAGTCATIGYPAAAARQRIEATVEAMAEAGELSTLQVGGEEALAGLPTRHIFVNETLCAVVGIEPAEGAAPWPDGRGSRAVIRHILGGSEPVPLTEELGAPSFLGALRMLGIVHGAGVGLPEFAGLLRDAIIRLGEPVGMVDIRVFGRASDDPTFGFGHVVRNEREEPAVFRLGDDGSATCLMLRDADALAWVAAASARQIHSPFAWHHPEIPLPRQLKKALRITGRADDDDGRAWTLRDGAAEMIAAWLGMHEEAPEDGTAPDPAQRTVIEASASARLVVEAGPGSGKTRVACQRVARLLEKDVAASRIWMVSFTRAAVGEIRERIASFLPDPELAAEVTVMTLDSLAWRLRSGFIEAEERVPVSGYNENIAETVTLLEQRDTGLGEFLGKVEHLVLDEAQDLTGERRKLVMALVRALAAGCGVTLFTDSAQAIYGFNDKVPADERMPIKDLLLGDPRLAFSEVRLDTDHRTRSLKLKHLFKAARDSLLAGETVGRERYREIRELIEEASDGVFTDEVDGAQTPRGSTLRLFRYRGQMMSTAADLWAKGISCSVHLADRAPAVAPWLGALLAAAGGVFITRDSFEALWSEIWPPAVGQSADSAWTILRRLGPGPSGSVRLATVRERLAAPTPPLDVIVRTFGRKGIVLSTIHGAKGREADHVQLVMPREPREGELFDWDEEARILFVGATRARKSLRLGPGVAGVREGAGIKRLWQSWTFKTGRNARVEIGLDDDVDANAQVNLGRWGAPEQVNAAQKRLWELAAGGGTTPLVALREGRDDEYTLFEEGAAEGAPPIGFLSAKVIRDLWTIGKEVHGGKATPPHRIEGLRLIGARTVAMTADEISGLPDEVRLASPYAENGIWLAPVVAGVVPVFYHV